MSISSISSSNSSQAIGLQSNFQQKKQAFQQLSQALQSGDLQKAQQAFTALTQNSPKLSQAAGGQAATDLQAVGQALSSGNLADAKTAFAAFQQDIKVAAQPGAGAVAAAHHHHHHHHQVDSSSPDPTTTAANDSNGTDSTGAQISRVDLLA